MELVQEGVFRGTRALCGARSPGSRLAPGAKDCTNIVQSPLKPSGTTADMVMAVSTGLPNLSQSSRPKLSTRTQTYVFVILCLGLVTVVRSGIQLKHQYFAWHEQHWPWQRCLHLRQRLAVGQASLGQRQHFNLGNVRLRRNDIVRTGRRHGPRRS